MLDYLKPYLGKVEAELLLDRFRAFDVDAAKMFISQGLGISIMPNVIAKDDVAAGIMWAVRLPGNPYHPFYGVWGKS